MGISFGASAQTQPVEQVFNDVSRKADTSFEIARQYAQELTELSQSFTAPASGIGDVDIPDGDYSEAAVPSIPNSVLNATVALKDAPANPILSDIPTVNLGSIPVAPADYIARDIVPPTQTTPEAPENPTLSSISIPDPPDFTIPQAPVDQEISFPVKPTLNMPSFSVKAPDISDFDVPTTETYQSSEYQSDAITTLLRKVLADIENGGTGLDVDVEAAIYDRGRQRLRFENEALYRQTEDLYGNGGFDLPPISMASKLADVGKEISLKNDQLNREIIISQAELEQGNIKFSVEQLVVIEKMFRDFFVANESRRLEAVRTNTEAGIQIYNAMVEFRKFKLSNFQVQAAVYRDRIEAEKARVEIYRVEMEGAKISLENKEVLYKIYGMQVSIVETKAKIYSAMLESARIESEIQSQKVAQAKVSTEIYQARIQAEGMKADLYKAETEGERNKVLAYAESVKAYESKVRAKLDEGRIKSLNAENTLKANQQQIEMWSQQIVAWAHEIDAEIKAAGLEVDRFRTETDVYATKVQSEASRSSVSIENIKTKLEAARLKLQRAEIETKTALDGYVSLNNLKVEASKGVMNTGAQLAASAMNAINASAGMSMSSSYTTTESESTSDSTSRVFTYPSEEKSEWGS